MVAIDPETLKSKKDRSSNELCRAIAKLADRIANKSLRHHIAAYSGGLLISLDKNPAVRPIGMEEVLQKVFGRCIEGCNRKDLQDLGANNQMCPGQNCDIDYYTDHSHAEIFHF